LKLGHSALASGLLTGKYNKGIPKDSRYANHTDLGFMKEAADSLSTEE
jgi:aryl-alcohol dehydrogenase-like predicted oxidoreductase